MRDPNYRDELSRLIPRLRQVARALVQDGTAGTADDLVQATLVRVLATDERHHGERLLAWLLSIMTSLNRAQIQAMGQNRITAGGRTATGPSASFPARGSRETDPCGLGTLPLDEREALVLIVLGRLSYMQAAEALSLSITSLVQRLSRARDRLAEQAEGARVPALAAASAHAPARRAATHLRVVK